MSIRRCTKSGFFAKSSRNRKQPNRRRTKGPPNDRRTMAAQSAKNNRPEVAAEQGRKEEQSSPAEIPAAKTRLEGPERALKAATIFLSSVEDFRFCAAVYGNPVRRDYWIGRLTENLAARKTELS